MLEIFCREKLGRVTGLSFHSKKPWILVSLHCGKIQLWDYQAPALLCLFNGHTGPVCGIHFHQYRRLFVSGGDDYMIRVWCYQEQKCLFMLLGHLGCVRSVQFHHEFPWIVSASYDQTIRIWNWQTQTCISVLTGHGHYVMCASFHPKEDLIVSASLDQTIRIWDIGALRKKSTSPGDDDMIMQLNQTTTDLSGGVDVVVKCVLKGHENGVTSAAFHPTLPLIVSGSDDNQVKLWHMNDDANVWKVDTLRGHENKVTCVIFHGKQDMIVSSSVDNSIRFWDATKQTGIVKLVRKHERFWVLAAQPETNYLAFGHDTGLVVFKLERERPAFSVRGDTMFYVKNRLLRFYEFPTEQDTPVISLKRRPGLAGSNQDPRTLSYSPAENAFLMCSDANGGFYELYVVPKEVFGRSDLVLDAKIRFGGPAVFIARNRFAVLDKSKYQILVKNLQNDVVKKIELPIPTDDIFYAGTGKLLCRAKKRVVIFDLRQRIILGEVLMPNGPRPYAKYIVWSNDMESVALLSKYTIVIASKRLVHQCTLFETIHVKGGAWDDNGVFIYTTSYHIKYCLLNGDSGVIKALEAPIYITKISRNTIFFLDRDGASRTTVIDATEYILKLFVMRKSYDHVMNTIRSSQLVGQATAFYLQQKGFAEVALHVVKDKKTRFNLALEIGDIHIAAALANEIDEQEYWYRFGVDALRQGNVGIVEYAYHRAKKFGRLSFLYLVTGNMDKLHKMLKIANGITGQLHNALYLGDVQERVKILENAGHLPLAYITSSVHGLHDIAERLSTELGNNVPSLPKGKVPSLLIPPPPILCGGDWAFSTKDEEDVDPSAWAEKLEMRGFENIEDSDIAQAFGDGKVAEENEEEGRWDLGELDLPPVEEIPKAFAGAEDVGIWRRKIIKFRT